MTTKDMRSTLRLYTNDHRQTAERRLDLDTTSEEVVIVKVRTVALDRHLSLVP